MTTMMKAIGFKEHLPIESKNSLLEFETPKPTARAMICWLKWQPYPSTP